MCSWRPSVIFTQFLGSPTLSFCHFHLKMKAHSKLVEILFVISMLLAEVPQHSRLKCSVLAPLSSEHFWHRNSTVNEQVLNVILAWVWYSITPWLIKIKFCRQCKGLEKEHSHVLITCKPVLMSKYVKTKLEFLFHLGLMWESLLTTACLLDFKQKPWTQSLLSTLPMFAKHWQLNPNTPKPLLVQVPWEHTLHREAVWKTLLNVNIDWECPHLQKTAQVFSICSKSKFERERGEKKIVNQIKRSMSMELLNAPKAILRYCSLRTCLKLNSQIPKWSKEFHTRNFFPNPEVSERCLENKHTCNLLCMSNLSKGHSIPMFKFLYKHRKKCHESALLQPASRIIGFMLVRCTFQHGLRKENGTWGNDKFCDHSLQNGFIIQQDKVIAIKSKTAFGGCMI